MMPPIAKIDGTARRSYPYGRAEAALAIKDLGGLFEPFKETWENRDYYGYNIRDENAPWYKQVRQTIVHGFGGLTPISVSSAQRALDTGGTWSKDAVLAVLGFGPAPSYAERSTIQNRISFL